MSTAGLRNILRQRKPLKPVAERERPADTAEHSAGFASEEVATACQDLYPNASSVIEGMR